MQEMIAELADNFTKRLIASGYRSASVKKAVAKHVKLMSHAVLVDRIHRRENSNAARTGECRACPICEEGATRRVFGHGNPSSPVMFVGEGPGEHEDLFGIPFIGIAGTALTMWLEKMPLKREQVYITNVLKCRPRNNRTPTPVECQTCIREHLSREIDIIKPAVIIAVGGVALKGLIPEAPGITQARGTWFEFRGIPLVPVFHPAYVLRKVQAEFVNVNQLVYKDLMLAFSRLT